MALYMIKFLIKNIKTEAIYYWAYFKFTFGDRYKYPKRFLKSLRFGSRVKTIYREYKFRCWIEYAKKHNMKINITDDYLNRMLNK